MNVPAHRRRLPHRRRNQTIEIDWRGQRIAACVGYDADGRPAEVFARLVKPGSELDLMLDDLGVLLSLLLQHGVEPTQLVHSIGRQHGEAASVAGVLVDLLADSGGGFG